MSNILNICWLTTQFWSMCIDFLFKLFYYATQAPKCNDVDNPSPYKHIKCGKCQLAWALPCHMVNANTNRILEKNNYVYNSIFSCLG